MTAARTALRNISWRYLMRTTYEDGITETEVIWFPRPMWFATTLLLFTPAGRAYRLPDGSTATVRDPEPE